MLYVQRERVGVGWGGLLPAMVVAANRWSTDGAPEQETQITVLYLQSVLCRWRASEARGERERWLNGRGGVAEVKLYRGGRWPEGASVTLRPSDCSLRPCNPVQPPPPATPLLYADWLSIMIPLLPVPAAASLALPVVGHGVARDEGAPAVTVENGRGVGEDGA